MPSITALYQVTSKSDEIEKLSHDIALEQTVEVPRHLVTSKRIHAQVVGKVLSIEPLEIPDAHEVAIAYNAALACGQLPQLLNLVFGNISIKNNIRLKNIALPPSLTKNFIGPKFGVEKIRRRIGVWGRPLLSTALKPRGATDAQLAKIAADFALGGGDIIKDDHNLVDESFAAFQSRVTRVRDAVARANARTGRECLYFPNLCYPARELEKRLDWALRQGISGILLAPLVIGLDVARDISERHPSVTIMAHPTFAGTFFHDKRHGMEPGVLLGTLFRLAGADISVFPNHGGRFHFTHAECDGIADSLKRDLNGLNRAFPAPAGGMNFENIPPMARQYGEDVVFICGGALLAHGRNLRESTALFREKVCEHFSEELTPPETAFASSCEIPAKVPARKSLNPILRFLPGFEWEDVPAAAYKQNKTLPFSRVTRRELFTAGAGEEAFDLRYFEIAPGGFTCLEKHKHTHVIAALRGEGVLLLDGKRHALKPFDVARVAPGVPHQVRNANKKEPFGFFCIVDHERDAPQPV